VVLLLLLLKLWAVAPKLRRSAQLSHGWHVNHVVLRGSTARTASRGSWHDHLPPLLLGCFTGLHSALLIGGCTSEIIVGQVGRENQMILQLNCEPHAIELDLLLVSVNVVIPVLCHVVELLSALVD
jgi:hypothetical protein